MAHYSGSDYFIWLSEICGAGSSLPKRVYEAFDGDVKRAYEADMEEYNSHGIVGEEADILLDKDFTRANSIVDYCAENRVGILCFGAEYYPKRLYDIEDPPPVLYYCGRVERLAETATVTAIGSRRCTEAAYEAGYSISFKLASAGVSLVTGMAEGIDTACTLGALDGGGFCVGVLGSGINILYPFENHSLFTRMFKAGLIITEFSPYTEPKGVNFPIRNRIMAALCDGVLVVEARSGSGALITADLAKAMGKRIFAMPGNVTDSHSRGSNELIRDGATPVIEVSDILCELEYSYPEAVSVRRSKRERLAERDSYISRSKRRKEARLRRMEESKAEYTEPHRKRRGEKESEEAIENPNAKVSTEGACVETDLSMLSEAETAVYNEILRGALTADAIGRSLEMKQDEVLAALTMLEIYGVITSLPGGAYEAVTQI